MRTVQIEVQHISDSAKQRWCPSMVNEERQPPFYTYWVYDTVKP